jgi:ribosomal protein S18 acetylase RimI-like enzyme
VEVAALLSRRPELVRSDWQLPSFELEQDAWVVDDRGRIVGYAAVLAGERLEHTAAAPEVADRLLELAVERARALGFRTLSLTTDGETDFIRRHAFELAQETLVMWRRLDGPVEEPGWPAGISARTFEPADADAVHAMLDEAYLAWNSRYVPIAHDDWLRWMTGDPDFDPTVWWLAERDGETVGCALHWRTGWLKDLAVRASERGRGVGTALVRQGLAEFARRGIHRVGLKVDAANPTGAVRLYERLGFVVERQEATWALSL